MTIGHDRASGLSDAASESLPRIAAAAGDGLSDVLETIRLRGALFFVWEPAWHYVTHVPDGNRVGDIILPGAEQIISYHIVAQGPCWGAVPGEEPVRLETGDVLLLPHGDPYCIASRPHPADTREDEEALAFFRLMADGALPPVIVEGGGDRSKRNRLVCGFLGCERQPFNPLLASLPRLLRLRALEGTEDPLVRLSEFAVAESRRGEHGERCLLARLSEVMFVEVLRRYLRTAQPDGPGWLAGLRDPLVGRALALLHRRPGQAWTLSALAHELATSRSTLADHFSDLVGEPPMQYLARWRMQLAARRLTEVTDKIYTVARDVGYDSEAAFSRAFRRWNGVSPRQWREWCAAERLRAR